jgi:hypothetical protein
MLTPALKPRAEILIGGDWRPPAEGGTIPVVNPSDGQTVGTIARGLAADIDRAVAAARGALDGAWGRLPAMERGRLLLKLSRAVLDRTDDLTLAEAVDTGKPMKQARADIVALARYFEYYGGAADKVHGEMLPYLDGYTILTIREPYGVTGHIIPWNYPAQIFGRSVGAALAMGNACVVKPAEDASLSALMIGQMALEVGFPPGALNIVPGYGEEAGAALAGHPGIDHVSFTGSPEVGTLVQQAAALNHRPVTLELGGKSAQIVFADADPEAAVRCSSALSFRTPARPARPAHASSSRKAPTSGSSAPSPTASPRSRSAPATWISMSVPSYQRGAEDARYRLSRPRAPGGRQGARLGQDRAQRAARRVLCRADAARRRAARPSSGTGGDLRARLDRDPVQG